MATGEPFADTLPLPTVKAFPDHVTLSWLEQETARRHTGEEGLGFGVRMFAGVTANTSSEGLLTLWEERRPDLVVLESGNVGAAVAAHVLGIPAVAVAVGVWGAFGPPTYAAVLDLAADQWRRHGSTPPSDPSHLLAAFLDPLPATLRMGVPEGVRHVPLRSVGFSHGGAPLPEWLLEPVRRPRVLLTLGTVAYEAVHVIRKALDGLLEHDVEVLVVLGPEGDPDTLGAVPDRVHLERFVPQEQVLADTGPGRPPRRDRQHCSGRCATGCRPSCSPGRRPVRQRRPHRRGRRRPGVGGGRPHLRGRRRRRGRHAPRGLPRAPGRPRRRGGDRGDAAPRRGRTAAGGRSQQPDAVQATSTPCGRLKGCEAISGYEHGGRHADLGHRRATDVDDAVALYSAHRLSLVRLAVLLVDDLQSAEDVVQDAFAGFLGRRRALEDPDQALAYLRTSVVNNARSALRRRGRAGVRRPARGRAGRPVGPREPGRGAP